MILPCLALPCILAGWGLSAGIARADTPTPTPEPWNYHTQDMTLGGDTHAEFFDDGGDETALATLGGGCANSTSWVGVIITTVHTVSSCRGICELQNSTTGVIGDVGVIGLYSHMLPSEPGSINIYQSPTSNSRCFISGVSAEDAQSICSQFGVSTYSTAFNFENREERTLEIYSHKTDYTWSAGFGDLTQVQAICSGPASPPVATAIPQSALPCITGTTSLSPTVQPTITPYGHSTGTPAPTRTPGGPTPTPTATHAPVSNTASYDSGLITFDSNIAQLSAVGIVNGDPNQFVNWSSEAGHDGRPGVAMMHAGMGDVYTVTAEEMISGSMVAVYKTGGYVSPIAVSLYGRTAYTLTAGYTHSLRVWYLDPDYNGVGQGVWVTSQTWGQGLGLSNSWRQVGAVVQSLGGSGRITAIGFTDERLTADPTESLPPCPSGRGCVYLDDLHIAYGAAAGLVLPYCDGTTGATNRPGRTCVIAIQTLDVYGHCIQPTTLADIGGWIGWIWCRFGAYFTPVDGNRAQLTAMTNSQTEVEPFGSIAELGGVISSVSAELDILQQQNRNNGAAPFDFSTMMDLSALDRTPDLHVASESYAYLTSCPAELLAQTATAMRGACMSVYLLRTTPAVQMIQWILNGAFIIMLIYVTINTIHNLAKN